MRKVYMSKLERASFGSKLGVILATAGSAVGLGNIWRFPYMTGQNGGAVFIVIYIFCVLLLGIPCMISEFIIGRHGQSNTARAFRIMSGGTVWSLIGYMGVLTGFLISCYYAVVSGWCLEYVWASFLGHLHGRIRQVCTLGEIASISADTTHGDTHRIERLSQSTQEHITIYFRYIGLEKKFQTLFSFRQHARCPYNHQQ